MIIIINVYPAIFIISLKRCEDLQERADWLKHFPGDTHPSLFPHRYTLSMTYPPHHYRTSSDTISFWKQEIMISPYHRLSSLHTHL